MDIFENYQNFDRRITYQMKVIEDKKTIAVRSSEVGLSDDIMTILLQDVAKAEAKLNEIVLDHIRETSTLEELIEKKVSNEKIRHILYLKFIQKYDNQRIADELGLSCEYTSKLITKGKKMILKG